MRKPSPSRTNGYRWDEIGNYAISTIKLPESLAEALDARYETLVYSTVDGKWDVDGSGEQSGTEAEAGVSHVAACDRIRRKIQ